MKSTSEVDIL